MNLEELHKDWEDHFYESEWEYNTLTMTETEEKILMDLKAFLPRHMPVYDWNLPYAEQMLLIVRRHIAESSV